MKHSKLKITPKVLFTYGKPANAAAPRAGETEPTTMTITITTTKTGVFWP